MMRLTPVTLAALLLAGRCAESLGGPAGDVLPVGTWGGDNAGMLVSDSSAHVHVGCTLGDLLGRIVLGTGGTFDVAGRYNLYAYPVDRGIYSPARFTGQAGSAALVLTVTVLDTVAHTTKVLGPVKLAYGKEPRMGPCPICRRPLYRLTTISRVPPGKEIWRSTPSGQRTHTAVGMPARPNTCTAPFCDQ
jgi:hypothetical protein